MSEQPTFASVTDVPCNCGYLQHCAEEPSSAIVFDASTCEYQFVSRHPEGGKSVTVIYHCPFCGGAAPKSKRHLLFAVIPAEEEARLARLLARVRTIRGAIKRLGKPEKDEPAGTQVRTHEADGQPPTTEHRHTLTYSKVSEVADVVITELANGRIHWLLMGKYIGPPASSGNVTGCVTSHADGAGRSPPDRVEDDPALSIEKHRDS